MGIQTPRWLGKSCRSRAALSMVGRGCRLHQRFVWATKHSNLVASPQQDGLFSGLEVLLER